MKLKETTLAGLAVAGAVAGIGSSVAGLMNARKQKKNLEKGILDENLKKKGKTMDKVTKAVAGAATVAAIVAAAALLADDEVSASEDENSDLVTVDGYYVDEDNMDEIVDFDDKSEYEEMKSVAEDLLNEIQDVFNEEEK